MLKEKIINLNIGEIHEISENMPTAITNAYQKCLEKNTGYSNNTKLNGSDYFGMGSEDHLKRISADITFTPFIFRKTILKCYEIGPLDGYYITFAKYYKHQPTSFSQIYNFMSIFTQQKLEKN